MMGQKNGRLLRADRGWRERQLHGWLMDTMQLQDFLLTLGDEVVIPVLSEKGCLYAEFLRSTGLYSDPIVEADRVSVRPLDGGEETVVILAVDDICRRIQTALMCRVWANGAHRTMDGELLLSVKQIRKVVKKVLKESEGKQ